MESTLRLIYFIGEIFAFTLLALVVWLFRHEKLNKREFFFWMCVSISLIFMSTMPSLLKIAADILGITYTYVAVIVISLPTFLFISLYLFTQLSDINKRVEKLAQKVTILEYYIRHTRDSSKEA